jgi:hypothetical protein
MIKVKEKSSMDKYTVNISLTKKMFTGESKCLHHVSVNIDTGERKEWIAFRWKIKYLDPIA